ncbi:conjugal transfer protein TraR [Chloroflexia bacterium SDU3-3]|nr:conjugal transfer protein TraR [Chloroflexia bacterium SDU3-3]
MDTQQLEHFRQRLQSERDQLTARQDGLVTASDDQQDGYGVSNHPAESASDAFLRERDMALDSNERDLIAEIDAALGRIARGTYGVCERTGAQIPLERLEALPYARYTIEGQQLVEQEKNT